jgi:hypothetical protein
MTERSKKWFDEAVRRGVDTKVAYYGAETIDSWSRYWKHEISDANLGKMVDFALSNPAAALHRWSILAGPQPWIPHTSIIKELKENPKFSVIDVLEKQNVKIPKPLGKPARLLRKWRAQK